MAATHLQGPDMAAFRPRQFRARKHDSSTLLRLTTSWCLDHVPPWPSFVIGVIPNDLSVEFQMVPLDGVDPLGELSTFVAPEHWQALLFSGHRLADVDGRFVLGVHRSGQAFLQIRFDDGTTATSTSAHGAAAELCRRALLEEPAAAS